MSAKLGLLLGGLFAPAFAETIHGVTVFSRHGDRSSKFYKGYQLTPLGHEQNFQVGSEYRARYLDSDSSHRIRGISEFEYVPSQIFATAPDQDVLLGTATSFMQGMYPPLEDTNPDLATTELNNGTEVSSPLGGYQYVTLHGVKDDAPDTIWIKGEDGCPVADKVKEAFKDSKVYKERMDDTREFYQQFEDVLDDVSGLEDGDFSYKNAYTIFDLVNSARIHNESDPALDVSDDDFFQLRVLADSSEFGKNFDPEHPEHSVGARTFLAGILAQLNETVATEAKLKFSLLAGSYSTMLAFFGVTDLYKTSDDFQGLPDYASTFSFELFTEGDDDEFPSNTDDLRVRFLFKNGTTGDLKSFRLFGAKEDSFAWPDFFNEMREADISSPEEWCGVCGDVNTFCAAYTGASATGTKGLKEGMSSEMKGGIAMIVIGGVLTVAAGLFFVLGMRKRRTADTGIAAGGAARATDKGSIHSGSTDTQV